MSVTYDNDTADWCDRHANVRAECRCPVPGDTTRAVPGMGDGQDPLTAHRGEVRMAYRLANAYADALMFVHGIGWHHWDGKRWAPDGTGNAERAVLDVLRAALAESVGSDNGADLRQDVRRCETSRGIAGVLKVASNLPAFAWAVEDLDRDPYLLNCQNGTLDLRTGELRSPEQADRITRVTTAAFDPQAPGTAWTTFLGRVLPDDDVRGYFQRLIGLSLLGKVREHIFPIATGTGANGKGTAYTAVLHALGDYGHAAESDLFMRAKANPNAASPALMGLLGKRLVVVSETEKDHHLAAALMKNLTGGDPITARPLYGKPVTFLPSHTPLMVTNYLPKVAGDDPAIWRRIRVIPFDVVIPPEERDGTLGERLEAEVDAILAWAVQGYQDYADSGMRTPEAVTHATEDYQHDSDAVGQFITEGCMTGPAYTATMQQLFQHFQTWCAQEGVQTPLGRKGLGEALDKHGYPAHGPRHLRHGIGIPANPSDLR